MGKVIMKAHPETGELGTKSASGNSVLIRVETEEIVNRNGYIDVEKRSALAPLSEKAAEILLKGKKDGDEFPMKGKIIVEESFKPFFEGQESVINPTTGEKAHIDGKEYYRNTKFVFGDEKDKLLDRSQANAQIEQEQQQSAQEL